MTKRIMDLTLSLFALVLLSPLMFAIGALILLIDGRPILFRQERVGRFGDTFFILKFRTMRNLKSRSTQPQITVHGDSRCTRLGWWLRVRKLDELPQLMNVIVGDMSLVGPRPEVPIYVAKWPDDKRDQILTVRPGITDPASTYFRDEATLLSNQKDPENFYITKIQPVKVSLYVKYIDEMSFVGDLRIMANTVKVLWVDRRA